MPVVIVLVQPQDPRNVGAVARAMKNTGLARLVVVDPPSFDPHRARWMAPSCEDVFEQMRIVGTLDDALVGVHRTIAATARHRRHDQPVHDPRALGEALADDEATVAILFGREDHGLSAEQVHRCESIVRIPTPEHASLNVAQAVLLVGHALFEGRVAHGAPATGRRVGGRARRATSSLTRDEAAADVASLEPVVEQVVALLAAVDYPSPAEKVRVTARGALQRAGMTEREVGALRGMLRSLGK